MAFSRLPGCGILVHLAVALSQDDVTHPPAPAVNCQQLSPVPRPMGEAVLVCEVFGIRRDEMAFYWWLDVTPTNIQTPIHTYSDIFDVDEITSTYRDMVVSETHVISERHMTSEIKLLINMTTNGVFKFEITMASHQTYTDEVEVSFKDPQITLDWGEIQTNYADGPNATILLVATCFVDVCFGKPIMSIICNNIEDADVTVIHEESQLDHQPTYFNGRRRIVMIHRNCLQVNCSVADERGTYQATRNITRHDDGNFMLNAPGSSWCEQKNEWTTLMILNTTAVILLMLSFVFLCLLVLRWRKSVKNMNRKWDGYLKALDIHVTNPTTSSLLKNNSYCSCHNL